MSEQPESPGSPRSRHIPELDGLRGVLAWYVAFDHILTSVGLRIPKFYGGRNAVDVFIILSGFVIFLLLDRRAESYRTFLTRRVFRLFPVYWTALAISIALMGVQIAAVVGSPFQDGEVPMRIEMLGACRDQVWPHALVYVGLLQGLVPWGLSTGSPWCYVGQAWSVSLEWQFYLLAPALFLAVRRYPVAIAVALGALTLVPWPLNYAFFFFPSSLAFFAVGICSYFLWRERGRVARPVVIVAIALLAALVARSIPLLVWVVVFGSLLARAFPFSELLRGFLRLRFVQYLGRVSYSTYLIHMVAIHLVTWVLNGLDLSIATYRVGMLVAGPLLAFAFAHATHVLVEAPGMRLGSQVVRNNAAPSVLAH